MVTELEAAHPFGALPEVEVRDEQPGGAAVLGIERLAVVVESDPGFPVGDILQRQIGRVAAIAEGEHVGSFVLDLLE